MLPFLCMYSARDAEEFSRCHPLAVCLWGYSLNSGVDLTLCVCVCCAER
jgi:hypothetical protein